MPLFEPTPRQTNVLVLFGCAFLGYALYLRYAVVEALPTAIACAAGSLRAVCGLRQFVIALSELQFFGGVALVAALVHFVRPSLALFATALGAAVLGLVLGNNGAAALAIGLLIIAFARPVRASNSSPEPIARQKTIAPASSRTFH